MSQNFKLIMENWRRFKKINEDKDNPEETEETEDTEETEETNDGDDGEGGAAGEGGETPEDGEGGAAGEGGEGETADDIIKKSLKAGPKFKDTPPIPTDTANAEAEAEKKEKKGKQDDGLPVGATSATNDATGAPVTDEFNASTSSGPEIISQIQQMLVDGGFAPAEQPSGVNKGQPFADGQFGNLTYKALLRARKNQKIA